jgi:hypothetical protein
VQGGFQPGIGAGVQKKCEMAGLSVAMDSKSENPTEQLIFIIVENLDGTSASTKSKHEQQIPHVTGTGHLCDVDCLRKTCNGKFGVTNECP